MMFKFTYKIYSNLRNQFSEVKMFNNLIGPNTNR